MYLYLLRRTAPIMTAILVACGLTVAVDAQDRANLGVTVYVTLRPEAHE